MVTAFADGCVVLTTPQPRAERVVTQAGARAEPVLSLGGLTTTAATTKDTVMVASTSRRIDAILITTYTTDSSRTGIA